MVSILAFPCLSFLLNGSLNLGREKFEGGNTILVLEWMSHFSWERPESGWAEEVHSADQPSLFLDPFFPV